jgi:hypothetical protein
MKMKNVKEVFERFSKELRRLGDIDIEARDMVRDLQRDVEQIEKSGSAEIASLLDRIRAIESRFAATHPALEKTARELADAIGKMGI